MFREGRLILDEVDLILHPLKSELNWPMGVKDPLDFTRAIPGTNWDSHGLRWRIPFHLLDALFYCHGGREGKMTVSYEQSREAQNALELLRKTVKKALEDKVRVTAALRRGLCPCLISVSYQFTL